MPEPIPFAEDGQWIRVPSDHKQTIACCDCGLVHQFEFRIRKGFIEWRSSRDEEATADVREEDNRKRVEEAQKNLGGICLTEVLGSG